VKSKTKVALAVLAAFALGGAMVEGLHAQAKSKQIYVVAQISVKDSDNYMKDYAPKAQALIKKSGGKIVAASSSPTVVEGKSLGSRVTVQLWPSMEEYKKYRSSTEFKQVRAIGEKYAQFNALAVEAME